MAKELVSIKNTGMAVISKELEEDFNTTSTNLEGLIKQGNEGLISALEILKATEATPRTVEAFASLLKTVSELNIKYLDIKKNKEIMSNGSNTNNKENILDKAKVVNNTQYVFTGSTDQLSKLVSDISTKEK